MSIAATNWDHMWQIFYAAVDCTAERRGTVVRKACGQDGHLRRRIEALLAAHDRAPGFLTGSAGIDPSHPASLKLIGKAVGPYQLNKVIGEGGMGVVYEATQAKPIHRTVALKVVRCGLDSPEALTRFDAERQALALMDHPNIARVFDAGVTAEGAPYFVMERVVGLPIHEYCDRHRLDVDQRLALFIPILAAVQHAHHKGIVHRDLKPSNIMVGVQDGTPVVKVIDFGVAKALDRRLWGSTPVTEHGMRIGTPEYMSPEQAAGALDVDTRADIYSLGVLLYELLTGVLPLADHQSTEGEARCPSLRVAQLDNALNGIASRRRIEPTSFARRLRGDIDWIVMRAIESERTRRYATASEMQADILRHVRNEPILAGPPTVRYRFTKFLRRHRLGVLASTAAGLGLMAGMAGVVGGWRQANTAVAVAESQRDRAEHIGQFLRDIIAGVTPEIARGKDTALLRDILDAAARRVDTELPDAPQVAADVRVTLGRTYHSLGLYDAAEPHLAAALATYTTTYGEFSIESARVAGSLALLKRDLGRYAESEMLNRRILEVQQALLGEEHEDTQTTLNNLALVLKNTGRFDEAGHIHEQLLAVRLNSLAPGDRRTVISMSNLANVRESQNRLQDAEALLREALQLCETHLGADDPDTLITMDILGRILRQRQRFPEAEHLHRTALHRSRRVFGPTHPDTLAAQNHLASLLMHTEDYTASEALLSDVADKLEHTIGGEHPYMVYTLHNLARCRHKAGALDDARATFERARAIAVAAFPAEHGIHFRMAMHFADCLIDLGETRGAAAIVDVQRDRAGDDARSIALLRDVAQRLDAQGVEARSLARSD